MTDQAIFYGKGIPELINDYYAGINEAVALKLGWTPRKPQSVYPYALERNGEYMLLSELPDYCHSIDAAWEVVERFPFADDGKIKNGLAFQLMRRTPMKDPEILMWEAGWARYDDCLIVAAMADTAPMAICLAFLKLDEKES